MDILSRRDLLRCGVGATLISDLAVKARGRDFSKMPLVIDCVGPMAFHIDNTIRVVRIFLPKLVNVATHEAGIGTSVTGILLCPGDYCITGPTAETNNFTPWGTNGSTVYQNTSTNYSAPNRYIGLTIPLPKAIIGLEPVPADIYPTNGNPSGKYPPYAVGLRFVYDQANKPQLVQKTGPPQDIPFDPAPEEIQLNISIGYSPTDYKNGDTDAQSAFNQLSKLFPTLDLTVRLGAIDVTCSPNALAVPIDFKQLSGPNHDCKAPIILLG